MNHGQLPTQIMAEKTNTIIFFLGLWIGSICDLWAYALFLQHIVIKRSQSSSVDKLAFVISSVGNYMQVDKSYASYYLPNTCH